MSAEECSFSSQAKGWGEEEQWSGRMVLHCQGWEREIRPSGERGAVQDEGWGRSERGQTWEGGEEFSEDVLELLGMPARRT